MINKIIENVSLNLQYHEPFSFEEIKQWCSIFAYCSASRKHTSRQWFITLLFYERHDLMQTPLFGGVSHLDLFLPIIYFSDGAPLPSALYYIMKNIIHFQLKPTIY